MEFSTLNGYKVKDKKAIRYYDTVNDMKADTTLKNGMHVKTKGYYAINDGGHGEYFVVSNNELVDDGGSIHTLTNGLKAILIADNQINIKQFGAYGNNVNDDTQSFIKAIAKFNNIFIPTGTYLITDEVSINNANKSVYIYGNNDCTIKVNNESEYPRFLYGNLFNEIYIKGINFEGMTFETNGDYTYPSTRVIVARNGNNIKIEHCNFKNARNCYHSEHLGDPENEYLIKNILINENTCKDCSLFVHVCDSNNVKIDNNYVSDVIWNGGGSGSCIIYIRPNIENLFVTNNYFADCTGDVLHNNRFDGDISYPSDLTIQPVKYMHVSNNTFKNIGNLIGFNSFNDKVIIENNIVEGVSKRVITSYKGYCNDLNFNNNVIKNYNILMYKESVSGDQIIDTIRLTNNRFINGQSTSNSLIIDNKVNNICINDNYFENYTPADNTNSVIDFRQTVKNINISNNIFYENVSSSNYNLIQLRNNLVNEYTTITGNKTIGSSKVNVFVYSAIALTRLYITNNILDYCSNLATGNATVISNGNIRNGTLESS